MALDTPVVALLPILLAAVVGLAIYGVYRLAIFFVKVNRYIDDQERQSKTVTREA